jgi:uncharacterized protein (TIGR02466 family)
MPVEHWFSTPIYYDYVDDLANIQKEMYSVMEDLNFSKAEGWGTKTHAVSDNTFTENLIDIYDLKYLKAAINHHVLSYIAQLNSKCDRRFRISACWLTKTQPGQYTRVHNHGYSDMSGVFYLKTNRKDGSLVFLSPIPCLSSTIYADIIDTVSYEPEVGKILLFPGWLYHTVGENDTEEERLSVSFNIYFSK